MVNVMTPKEKAEQLFELMCARVGFYQSDKNEIVKHISKSCSLVALNELVKESSHIEYQIGRDKLSNKEYWQQVIIETVNL